MPSIMDKLKKNSTIAHTEVLSESQFFGDTDVVPTDVPMINVALSGNTCLLYTSQSPRDMRRSRMPSSA